MEAGLELNTALRRTDFSHTGTGQVSSYACGLRELRKLSDEPFSVPVMISDMPEGGKPGHSLGQVVIKAQNRKTPLPRSKTGSEHTRTPEARTLLF